MPTDTPIIRTRITDMSPEQLVEYVGVLQVRRLAAFNIYQLGVKAKQKAQDNKDIALVARTLERFEKKYDTVRKGLDALEKMAVEIQAARIAIGDL